MVGERMDYRSGDICRSGLYVCSSELRVCVQQVEGRIEVESTFRADLYLGWTGNE